MQVYSTELETACSDGCDLREFDALLTFRIIVAESHYPKIFFLVFRRIFLYSVCSVVGTQLLFPR